MAKEIKKLQPYYSTEALMKAIFANGFRRESPKNCRIDKFRVIDTETKEEARPRFIEENEDWAIEQVIEEQERFKLYEQAINHKIEKLKEDLLQEKEKSENRTSWLRFKLGEYIKRDDVPAKDTKTQMSLKLPSGTIKFIKSKLDYDRDDDELLEYCKENATDFIKIKESVNWIEFKKHLEIKNDIVINKDTGEIIDGINVIEVVPKIEIK